MELHKRKYLDHISEDLGRSFKYEPSDLCIGEVLEELSKYSAQYQQLILNYAEEEERELVFSLREKLCSRINDIRTFLTLNDKKYQRAAQSADTR